MAGNGKNRNMQGALIILAVTIITGFVLYLIDKRKHPRAEAETTPNEPEIECCGKHMVCEKTSLAVMDTEIEYFDDEELDAYQGRGAADYTEAETEQFREVMLTMQPTEIPAWARSLQLRGITPPAPIRDEILLIATDLRS